MNSENSPYDIIDTVDPVFEKIAGLNAPPIDARLLINNISSSSQFLNLYYRTTAGTAGDATYRVVNMLGNYWNIASSQTASVLVGLGTQTVEVTKQGNIPLSGNSITLNPWKTISIKASFQTATQLLQVTTTGGVSQFLYKNTLFLDKNTQDTVTFMSTATTDITVWFSYATTASDLPRFGLSIEIN